MVEKNYGQQRTKVIKKNNIRNFSILFVLALWILAVMAWGSYRMAKYYNFDKSLGSPIMIYQGKPIYSPLKVISLAELGKDDPKIKQMSDQTYMVAIGAPMLLILTILAMQMGLKGREDLHGSARWAKFEDIETMGYLKNEGVYVGGWWDKKKKKQYYLRHNGPEHILVFAPTRSGKGVGLILPTLLSWPHSSVVLDIKGENFALTSGFMDSLGHKVIRFDPSDSEGTSAAFNPFEEIEINSPMCIPDVQRISSMIMDPLGKGFEDYWGKAAFSFFGGALLHGLIKTKYERDRAATFYDLALMLEDPARPVKELFEEMIKMDHIQMLTDLYPDMPEDFRLRSKEFIGSAARGMLSKADNELSGVVNTATSNLALYKDPVVAKNTSRCDFRLNDLMNRDEPVNLYLVVSPADIDRIRPLLRIFVAQLLNKLTGRMDFEEGASVAKYQHRLLLLLDEFTSLGKISIIERAIAYMAGYGIKAYFIVQDTKQLNQAYGQDNALMANCHIRIAYAPNLAETAEYLSKMLGQTTVVDKKASISQSKGGSSRSISVSETARPLLTPGECMTLPGMSKEKNGSITPGDMLIITAGNPPIYGRQILYFIDPIFSARAKVAVPGVEKGFSRGLSNSLYWSMPNVLGSYKLEDESKEESKIILEKMVAEIKETKSMINETPVIKSESSYASYYQEFQGETEAETN
jgi:type IV secretion system protein VirD4